MTDEDRRLMTELADCVVTVGDAYLQLSSVEADQKHLVGRMVRRAIEIRDRVKAVTGMPSVPVLGEVA